MITMHKDLWKIDDPLITKLGSGAISVEQFCMLLMNDVPRPYMLIGNVVYPLTEDEFYASLKWDTLPDLLTKEEFDKVIKEYKTMDIPDAAKEVIATVASKLGSCSPCHYKRYKKTVEDIVHKYNIFADRYEPFDEERVRPLPYYRATEEFESAIRDKLRIVPELLVTKRRDCLDCVEKHVAQAYILSKEVFLGYPEHIVYMYGHLSEAITELGDAFPLLRDTLVFCVAESKNRGTPFIPFAAILQEVELLRETSSMVDTSKMPAPAQSRNFVLDISEQMRRELAVLPKDIKEKAASFLVKAEAAKTNEEWLGAMATCAEFLAGCANKTANMIRARRISFSTDHKLARSCGYDMSDVIAELRK